MKAKKTKRNGFKKNAVFFLFLFIVVASTVWLTMALLTARSDDTRNTFTLGKGVDVILEEPKFSEAIELTDGKRNFSPGDLIDKDPTVLIGENGLEKEYIAAKVYYYIDKNGDGIFSDVEADGEKVSYTEFKTYASIGTQTDESDNSTFSEDLLGEHWFTIDDYETFFYGTGTAGSGETAGSITELIPFEKKKEGVLQKTVLFNKVKVDTDIPVYGIDTYNAEGTLLYRQGQPMSFQIHVKAYAVQAGEGIIWQQAAYDFKNTFGLNVGTTEVTP